MKRIGLVLSGGGVNGAFQAGLVSTVREAGCEFRAAAGSSVGAFNAVLATSRWSRGLRHFWLESPETFQLNIKEANERWLACLAAFDEACDLDAIEWRELAKTSGPSFLGDILRRFLPSQSAGTMARSFPLDFTMLGAFSGMALMTASRMGKQALAFLRIRKLMATTLEAGPMISPCVVEFVRQLVETAWKHGQTGPVYTAVSTLRVTPWELLNIARKGLCESLGPGEYRRLEADTATTDVIASMSIPLLFGSNNAVNASPYVDGGLFDAVPLKALNDQIVNKEIDSLLVVDVSSSPNQVHPDSIRQNLADPAIPVLYVHRPSSAAGTDALRTVLEFGRARSLFETGRRFGWEIVQKLGSEGFVQVRA